MVLAPVEACIGRGRFFAPRAGAGALRAPDLQPLPGREPALAGARAAHGAGRRGTSRAGHPPPGRAGRGAQPAQRHREHAGRSGTPAYMMSQTQGVAGGISREHAQHRNTCVMFYNKCHRSMSRAHLLKTQFFDLRKYPPTRKPEKMIVLIRKTQFYEWP